VEQGGVAKAPSLGFNVYVRHSDDLAGFVAANMGRAESAGHAYSRDGRMFAAPASFPLLLMRLGRFVPATGQSALQASPCLPR
jgi:hypothetical protein